MSLDEARSARPLRVAVVGCGYWGPNLVRNFAAASGVEVTWVCDSVAERRDEMLRSHRVRRATGQYAEVLAAGDVDAVALATPLATHRPLGEAALKAGKHLWLEKPLATSVADAERLCELAEAHRRVLFVDHTYLYAPAVRRMRELVAKGELGEVAYFDAVRVNLGIFQPDASVIWDLGPHDVAIARDLLQAEPREVSAIGSARIAGGGVNLAYLTLKFDGTLLAHLHINWLAPVKVRLIMIGGLRRMLVYDDMLTSDKLKVYDRGVEPLPSDVAARREQLVAYRMGDMWSPHVEQTEPLALAVQDFVAAVRAGKRPRSDGASGLGVVRILEAAERSLLSGGGFVKA